MKDYKKLRKETRKEIRATLEFPKINYDNCQVEDSQEDKWLKVKTIKYSWDGSSQLPEVPTVPKKDNDRMLEYISKASTNGILNQPFKEYLQEINDNETEDDLKEVRSSTSDEENQKFLQNFTEYVINPLQNMKDYLCYKWNCEC
jgi:hypothetical protein